MVDKLKISLAALLILYINNVLAQTKPDIEKLDDAVVIVLIYDYKGNAVGHGSGFIIDEEGTVVTNYHVIKGASSLKIRTEINGIQEEYSVDTILSGDTDKDIAKLSIVNPDSTIFKYLKIAKSMPKKGDDCWAIGGQMVFAIPEFRYLCGEQLNYYANFLKWCGLTKGFRN